MSERHNIYRLLDETGEVSGEPRGDGVKGSPASGFATDVEPSPDPLSVLLEEVVLPILQRVNDSLDELERVVARIAEAPHG